MAEVQQQHDDSSDLFELKIYSLIKNEVGTLTSQRDKLELEVTNA